MSVVILAGGFALLGGVWVVAPQLGCTHPMEQWLWRDTTTIPRWRLFLQQVVGSLCLLTSLGLLWAPKPTLQTGALLLLLTVLTGGVAGIIAGPVLLADPQSIETWLDAYLYPYMRWTPPTLVIRGLGVVWFGSGIAGIVFGYQLVPYLVSLSQTILTVVV